MFNLKEVGLDVLLLQLEQQDVLIDAGLVREDGVIVGIQVFIPIKVLLLLMI